MNQYWVNVKYKNEPGSGWTRAIISAENQFAAVAMAKAMYGPLLLNEIALPLNQATWGSDYTGPETH